VDPAEIFARTPCNRLLGMRLVARTAQRCELELPVREELLQEERVVQGGILAALADVCAVYLLWPDLGPQRSMTSIEFKLNFLGAARLGGPALRAVAVPVRIGNTIAVCDSEVRQGDTLVAKGTFTYLLRARDAARQ